MLGKKTQVSEMTVTTSYDVHDGLLMVYPGRFGPLHLTGSTADS
jgi:hypothetical protein